MEDFIGPTAETISIPWFKFLFGTVRCSKCKNKMKFIASWKDYFKCEQCGHMAFYERRKK